MAEGAPLQNSTWERWHSEIEMASKAKGFRQWETRAKRIIKRYRDDRGDGDGAGDGMQSDTQLASKFNILWSNIQTLMPALFAKTPKPVVERRYLDRDDVGRTASVILERALLYELDAGGYQANVRRAVLDRLLPGRGVTWLRYEPKFSPLNAKADEPEDSAEGTTGDEELATPGENQPAQEQVASESTCVDYVDWQDFRTSSARTWEEVWWVDRMVYMSRAQLVARFGEEKGGAIPLDWTPNKEMKSAAGSNPDSDNDDQKRAKIHETWCKTERKVYWWADGWSDEMLDEKDDPLKLEGFWPCPKPLYGTLTNDSLIPVPDYYEYQDQAVELDDLTNRIAWLTKAIKIAGVSDASIPELQRLFLEGKENELIGVDNMSEFMQKAGPNGMGVIWLVPLKEMIGTLNELHVARDQVKQSLYEITGISDIVRGSASLGGAKTATEQRIKGQFASMRLNDMQAEVARFCRDTLRIMGEIIAEHFDPMTLFLISGFEQYAKEQWPASNFMKQAAQMAQASMSPPMPGQPPVAPPIPPQQIADQLARQKATEMFKAAIALLKNDKLRGFRIDIETDSIVEPDQEAMQQSRTQLLQAIAQFLPEAIQAGMAMPELKPLLARLLMFFLRGYKASRDIESAFEQFVDDMTKQAANPPPKPPSPEQMKAQAEQQKAQAEIQHTQMQGQIEQQKAQQDAQQSAEEHRQQMELIQAKADADERAALMKMAQDAMKGDGEDAGMSAQERMRIVEMIANVRAQPSGGDIKELIKVLKTPRKIIRGPDGKAQGSQLLQ